MGLMSLASMSSGFLVPMAVGFIIKEDVSFENARRKFNQGLFSTAIDGQLGAHLSNHCSVWLPGDRNFLDLGKWQGAVLE